jgi:hypothetical protein
MLRGTHATTHAAVGEQQRPLTPAARGCCLLLEQVVVLAVNAVQAACLQRTAARQQHRQQR